VIARKWFDGTTYGTGDENLIEIISIDFSHTAGGDFIAEIDYNLTPAPEPEE
jgi:hypothetical protein